MDAARAFALAEKAEATRRAYRGDFHHFSRCVPSAALSPMPRQPDTGLRLPRRLATAGAKASTIGRRAAAIRYAHQLAGHEPPTNVEAVKAVMRGIRRTIGTAREQKAPATADRIGRHARAASRTP